jgi:co-chaperonin GroES (HSP10)
MPLDNVKGESQISKDGALKLIEKARKVYNNRPSMPAGYRLKILSIPAEKGLEESEAAIAPTLAKMGFEIKSEEQKRRETKGADRGIIVDIGKGAWKGEHLLEQGDWAEIGQIVLYVRYSGKEEEEPKGSGIMYRFING